MPGTKILLEAIAAEDEAEKVAADDPDNIGLYAMRLIVVKTAEAITTAIEAKT